MKYFFSKFRSIQFLLAGLLFFCIHENLSHAGNNTNPFEVECQKILRKQGFFSYYMKRRNLCEQAQSQQGVKSLSLALDYPIRLNNLVIEELLKVRSQSGIECVRHLLETQVKQIQPSQLAVCNHIRSDEDFDKLKPVFKVSQWHNSSDIELILNMENPIQLECVHHLAQRKKIELSLNPAYCSEIVSENTLELLKEVLRIPSIKPTQFEINRILEVTTAEAKDCLISTLNNNPGLFSKEAILVCQNSHQPWPFLALELVSQSEKINDISQLRAILSLTTEEGMTCLSHLKEMGIQVLSGNLIDLCQMQTPDSIDLTIRRLKALPLLYSADELIQAISPHFSMCFSHFKKLPPPGIENLDSILQREPNSQEISCYHAILETLATSQSHLVKSNLDNLNKQIQFAKALFERRNYFIQAAARKTGLNIWHLSDGKAHGAFHAESVRENLPSEQFTMEERLNRIHNVLIYTYLLAQQSQTTDQFFNDAFTTSSYCIDGRTETILTYLLTKIHADSNPFFGISNRTQLIHHILKLYQQECLESKKETDIDELRQFVTRYIGKSFNGVRLNDDLVSDTLEAGFSLDIL